MALYWVEKYSTVGLLDLSQCYNWGKRNKLELSDCRHMACVVLGAGLLETIIKELEPYVVVGDIELAGTLLGVLCMKTTNQVFFLYN